MYDEALRRVSLRNDVVMVKGKEAVNVKDGKGLRGRAPMRRQEIVHEGDGKHIWQNHQRYQPPQHAVPPHGILTLGHINRAAPMTTPTVR